MKSNQRSKQNRPASHKPIQFARSVFAAAMLFAFIPVLSFGQGYVEGVSISYEHLPMKIEAPDGDQKFTGNNLKVSISNPLFLTADKSKYLIVGANLEAFNFAGTHPDFEVKRVYSISPTIGYSTMLRKNWNLTALVVPTMNSDYKDVKGSDIKFGGILRSSWRTNDHMTWRATLGYRRQFYGPQYIALIGMDWKASDKWRLYGDIPSSFTASYAVSEKVNTGFNLFVQNSTYRLNNLDRYFEYNTVNPGLFIERYLSPKWALRANAAYTLIRNMEIYNKDDKAKAFVDFAELGDRKDPVNPEVSTGVSLKIGLSYRIVPGKK